MIFTLLAGFSMLKSTFAGTVPRPVFCDAILATGATAPRAATVDSIGDARAILRSSTRFNSLRQNQLITDVNFRRTKDLDRELAELESATVNLRDDVFVGREFRGFAEIAAARVILSAELEITGGSVERALAADYPVGRPADHLRHAASLALVFAPIFLAFETSSGEAGLFTTPLAAAALFANEVGDGWRRARKHGVPGLGRQLTIIDRVLNERDRLARGARALSIVRGPVTVPNVLHRGLLDRGRRQLTNAEFDGLVRASAPQVHTWADGATPEVPATQDAYFDSIFYTEAYTAEPRWLLYYRAARAAADPNLPVRTPPRPGLIAPVRRWLPAPPVPLPAP